MSIFISYRRADSKYVVDRIRERLASALGEEAVFRDIEDIPLGADYRVVLNKETAGCSVMLVVIGPLWAGVTDAEGNKRLFKDEDVTRIEIETGLNRKGVLVIPVLVMNAAMPTAEDVPPSLVEIVSRNGASVRSDPDFDHDMKRLILGINTFLDGAPKIIKLQHFEPETVPIPEGDFWMGAAGPGIPEWEKLHQVHLPTYRIGKFPVTNKQYQEFILQTETKVSDAMAWHGRKFPDKRGDYPVAGVNFSDAHAYCEWLSKITGRKYFLPNEAQWEKACRGGDACLYPWGDEFSAERCNGGRAELARVNEFPAQSEYGCFDLVGNIRQWTCSLWGEKRTVPEYGYPWEDDERNDVNSMAGRSVRRVVRGSSASDDPRNMRCSIRRGFAPDDEGGPRERHGFRVALVI